MCDTYITTINIDMPNGQIEENVIPSYMCVIVSLCGDGMEESENLITKAFDTSLYCTLTVIVVVILLHQSTDNRNTKRATKRPSQEEKKSLVDN